MTFALASHQSFRSMKLFQTYHYNLLLNQSNQNLQIFYETEYLYYMSVCGFDYPSKYSLAFFVNLHASPPHLLHVNVKGWGGWYQVVISPFISLQFSPSPLPPHPHNPPRNVNFYLGVHTYF